MSGAWIDFGMLLLMQFILFVAIAFYEKKLSNIWQVLGRGILIGIPFGLTFDLVLGKLLGLSTYGLGFNISFLLVNAAFSYGIFAATILLLRQERALYFCLATLFITALYEIMNIFLRVWQWQFPVPTVLYPVILATGYLIGAMLVMRIDRLLWMYVSR